MLTTVFKMPIKKTPVKCSSFEKLRPIAWSVGEPVPRTLVSKLDKPHTSIKILAVPNRDCESWKLFYMNAIKTGAVIPEVFADSAQRAFDKSALLKRTQRHTQMIDKLPTVLVEALRPKKAIPKCKALTLDGLPCKFNCVLGGFCSKHFVAKKI